MRSAVEVVATVSVTLALLFAAFGSTVLVASLPVAVFVITRPSVSEASTMAATLRVAVELAGRLPTVHVPLALLKLPMDDVAETKSKPSGRGSVTMTPGAVVDELRFAAVTVYFTVAPA
jgi:hypothetical protein